MAQKKSTTFLGPNKGLTILGDHAYAMSGLVTAGAVQNQEYPLLDFTTGGPEYIEAWIQIYASTTQANDFEINVKYNGQTIISSEYEKSYSGQFVNGIPRKVIIPANTKVQITAANTQGTTTADWCAVLTGRVYA